ncbi:Metalloenzyme, LuxS/M16 peptidase-like protein [Limtongia smithiae]|uniref:Metalloenzyme, LuxS/M16 peptidase-like protein n=1 Tax=Limtongia smithiae TaxID=1125753 RepID=UPI0034CE9425
MSAPLRARVRSFFVSRPFAATATVASSLSLLFATAPLRVFYPDQLFPLSVPIAHLRAYSSATMLHAPPPLPPSPGAAPCTLLADALERPELDNRSYRVVRLANDLEALLIHDPDTDKASAALDVRVGAFSDPKDLQGLAHFCEHLLFMGTVKYPRENEYSEFLSAHSGHSNAYTDSNDTNYFFEVGHDHLEGALDRFAQFFIAPLFLPDCKDREIRAVDSENKKNLQSDVWRLHQLDKALSNPDHPYSNFSTGNINTLDTEPVAKGIDVRDELLKFHDKYYSANVMKLVVLGREPLDQLESWAVEKFSGVKNSNASRPVYTGMPFTPRELQKQIFAKPVMDEKSLELSFLFPDQEPLFRTHPGHYYSHLIGHEGPGSILQYLKGKSWANSLSAGSYHICDGAEMFSINVDLTTEGVKNYEDVVVSIFQYLKMLQSVAPQEWIFEELRDVAAMSFRFRQKAAASSTTSRLASVMQRPLPREWLLSGQSLYREFDKVAIADSASYFTPEAFRFTLVSQQYPGVWEQKEKWYGTEYSVAAINPELIERIKAAPLNEALHLPAKNEFIATNFDVDKKEVAEPSKNPKLLKDIPGLRLWFKKDDTFWVPKANVKIALTNPVVNGMPDSLVKTRLFTELVTDSLSAYGYAANIAGLSYAVDLSWDGIHIDAQGYNHKLATLLTTVLQEIRDFKVNPERFAVIKERLHRDYRNMEFTVPYHQIMGITSYLFSESAWLTEEKLAELEAVTPEEVQEFSKQFMKHFNAEMLVHGNLSKEEALNLAKLLDETLVHKPLPASLEHGMRSYILPDDSKFAYKRSNKDPKNVNSCIEYYCQVGDVADRRVRCMLAILGQIGHEPAFNQLRTKEQLGYVVFSGVRTTRTLTGYRVLIQSEKTTEYLVSRIDAFLSKLGGILRDMPDETYSGHVKSLVDKKKEKLKNLTEETFRYWSHIQTGYYDFFRIDEEVQLLPTIKKEEVLELFETYVDPAAAHRSVALVQLQSQCAPPLPTLASALQSALPEFWKQAGLPTDKLPDAATIAELAATETPLAAFKDAGLSDDATWNAQVEPFLVEQIKLTTEPIADEKTVLVEDPARFKASLTISTAPVPAHDLSVFKELDAKL